METKSALAWCVDEAKENCMMRLIISPSPRTITLPKDYNFYFGKGTVLKEGKDAVLFSYGPVMLNEALTAAEMLAEQDFSLRVVNLPWLNRIDDKWLADTIGECETIFALDNHSEYGGLGDHLLNALMRSDKLRDRKVSKFAIEEYPACGTPQEALLYHQLDAKSLVTRILSLMHDMER
jgi:transketolase